jgi:outer membrane lipoprotein carrier protein
MRAVRVRRVGPAIAALLLFCSAAVPAPGTVAAVPAGVSASPAAAAGSPPATGGAGNSETVADSPGTAVLKEVAGRLLGLETFEAEFEQTQEWVGMDEPARARGVLYLRRPNLFRIEYREPRGHLQVSDGRKVWTMVPENREVLVSDLSSGPGGSGDPLRWILETSRAEPEVAADTVAGLAARKISLVPAPGSGLRRVRLWTRPGSPDLLVYEFEDEGGNLTRYRLTRTRSNPSLDPALFRFVPPPDIPVVELGAP